MKPRIQSEVAFPQLDFASSEPLLHQVANHFRRGIHTHRIPTGTRLPTSRELGNSIGLAPETINRAFTLLAREGLVYRRKSAGTFVGSVADATAVHASRKRRHGQMASPFCVIMREGSDRSDLNDILLPDYHRGLLDAFSAARCRFEIVYFKPDQDALAVIQSLVENGQIRGLVNLGTEREVTEYMVRKGAPVVSMNEDLTALGVSSVVTDHIQGYREGWQHVLALGHRRIGFVGYQEKYLSRRLGECRAGGQLAQADARIESVVEVAGRFDSDAIWNRLVETLGPFGATGRWPTLLFAQNDMLATRVIRALHQHQVRVPRDVSVIGFDDSPISQHFHPRLTTLAVPRFEVGQVAARLLLEVLANRPGSQGQLRVLPVQLVQRETCGAVSH